MKNEEFASFSLKLHGDSSFLVYHSSFSLCNLCLLYTSDAADE